MGRARPEGAPRTARATALARPSDRPTDPDAHACAAQVDLSSLGEEASLPSPNVRDRIFGDWVRDPSDPQRLRRVRALGHNGTPLPQNEETWLWLVNQKAQGYERLWCIGDKKSIGTDACVDRRPCT